MRRFWRAPLIPDGFCSKGRSFPSVSRSPERHWAFSFTHSSTVQENPIREGSGERGCGGGVGSKVIFWVNVLCPSQHLASSLPQSRQPGSVGRATVITLEHPHLSAEHLTLVPLTALVLKTLLYLMLYFNCSN